MERTKRKNARTQVYALIFGPADTAKNKNEVEPEFQKRKPDVLSYKEFRQRGKEIIRLFEDAQFGTRRERKLVAYYNLISPRGAKPFIYVEATDTFEEAEKELTPAEPSIEVRGETMRALEGWGAS